ncbi:MAG: hypothetical protein E6X17_00695 [Sporomusaceae bacterium]|nr:hypothetical protein [Sporomusaceae bacterium]
MNIASVSSASFQTTASTQVLQNLEAKEKQLQEEIKKLQQQTSDANRTQVKQLQQQLAQIQQQISYQEQNAGSAATSSTASAITAGPAYTVEISQQQ